MGFDKACYPKILFAVHPNSTLFIFNIKITWQTKLSCSNFKKITIHSKNVSLGANTLNTAYLLILQSDFFHSDKAHTFGNDSDSWYFYQKASNTQLWGSRRMVPYTIYPICDFVLCFFWTFGVNPTCFQLWIFTVVHSFSHPFLKIGHFHKGNYDSHVLVNVTWLFWQLGLSIICTIPLISTWFSSRTTLLHYTIPAAIEIK